MKISRTRAITVQTSQLLIIRQREKLIQKWCDECGKEVSMVTLEQSVTYIRRSAHELYCLMEAGRIHITETAEGLVLICMNSLLDSNS